jgi:hypothetical protein
VYEEKAATPDRMVSSVHDGDTKRFEEMLDKHVKNGIFTEDDRKYWLGRQKAYAVEYQAFQALENSPNQKKALQDANRIIDDNADLLSVNPDRTLDDIKEELKNESVVTVLRQDAARKKADIKAVDELFPLVGADGFTIRDIEAKRDSFGSDSEYLAFRSIAEGMSSPPALETDWKSYIKAQDKLFDVWTDRTHSMDKNGVSNELSIKTELSQLYAVDKKLSRETWAEMNYYLGTKIESDKRDLTEKVFKKISKMYNTVWMTNDEAKDIASARRAYFEWVVYNTNRKKDISIEDAIAEGSKLMAIHRRDVPAVKPEDMNIPLGERKTYKHTATNKKTGQQMGSNDGQTWELIQ